MLMKYKIYQMTFKTAVHFGNGRLSSTENTFYADRLFSALCIEVRKMKGVDGINKLVEMVKENRLCISDSFPYVDDVFFLPKPVMHIQTDKKGDSEAKKKFKKLSFIPVDSLDEFIAGDFNPDISVQKLKFLGEKTMKRSAAIFENDDAEPYSIGTYEFGEIEKRNDREYIKHDSGLYFIIGFENDEVFGFVDEIMYSLQYDGIGGKISEGLGKFDTVMHDVPDSVIKRLSGKYNRYMSLSVCMAKDSELDRAVENASYTIIKRSGFISSYDYNDTFVKKNNFYSFSAGSCFDIRFEGDVFNVGGKGTHPVYRYAKPMLLGVK